MRHTPRFHDLYAFLGSSKMLKMKRYNRILQLKISENGVLIQNIYDHIFHIYNIVFLDDHTRPNHNNDNHNFHNDLF